MIKVCTLALLYGYENFTFDFFTFSHIWFDVIKLDGAS